MKTITIGFDVIKEGSKKLSEGANKVYSYLYILHQGDNGKKGNGHIKNMEKDLNIKGRHIRHYIREIIEKNAAIIGNRDGYYIAKTKQEIENANNHEISRIKSSLTRLAQNGGSLGDIYKHMNTLVKIYPHIAEGQLNINGHEEKKTPHRPKLSASVDNQID